MKPGRLMASCLGVAFSLCLNAAPADLSEDGITWLRDEASAFAQAQQEGRPVLLYMEAVWCHWCHVMDQQTYADANVRELVERHFVPLRIDQDARPDLAARYRDYGWPATIFLSPQGVDLVKRQGFIGPGPFARLLQAIIADPTPEAAARIVVPDTLAQTSDLQEDLKSMLQSRHLATHDAELGGLTINQKFLDRDSVELDLVQCNQGEEAACTRARKTLVAAIALIDPVWGGVYQYSTHGDWDHPHYEKLGAIQGEYLRIYALGYAQFEDPRFAKAARMITEYLYKFLKSPQGGFYASQDADLIPGEKAHDFFAATSAERAALGMPRIDKQVYASVNGSIIEGLALWYQASGDSKALAAALAAFHDVNTRTRRTDGLYGHGNASESAFLADTVAMGRALLALYSATGEGKYLQEAAATAGGLSSFSGPEGGFRSAQRSGPIAAIRQIDENIAAVRWLNLMSFYVGNTKLRDLARHGMRYLATPEVALDRITEAGVLLADWELNHDPLHLTVVSQDSNELAKSLFAKASQQPGWYKRSEWWQRANGPLMNPSVRYPKLKQPAAYVCTQNRCSRPLVTVEDFAEYLNQQ